MDPESPASLEEKLRELRSRVQLLENALRARGIVLGQDPKASPAAATSVQHAVSAPAPTQQPQTAAPVPPPAPSYSTQPVAPPQFAFAQQQTPRDTRSLESRVGSQWFNRIGILAHGYRLLELAELSELRNELCSIGRIQRILVLQLSNEQLQEGALVRKFVEARRLRIACSGVPGNGRR